MSSSYSASPSPAAPPRVFRLFISYAREDAKVAIAVFNALQTALGPTAEVVIDSGLPFGLNFEEEIRRNLDQTDTLVVIDSEVLKPAFGFTGMELGYFISIMGHEPDRDFKRRIVPVYAEHPPEILAKHQGIKIGISPATLSMTLEEYEESLRTVGWDHPTVQFLREFQELVDDFQKTQSTTGSPIPKSPEQRALPDLVRKMQLAIFSHLKTTPESTLKPQKQITIRFSDNALSNSESALPQDALLVPVGSGNPFAIFGLERVETTWGDFQVKTKNSRFLHSWIDAITSVVTSALQSQLEVDNSQVIISSDEKHAYRVILTTGTKYYNGTREFNIYFVEYLRRGDFGDRDTTQLLKGLELLCRFRSMFLERASEFSSGSLKTTRNLGEASRAMERELNLLNRDAMELGLDKAHIWAEFVDWPQLEKMSQAWRPIDDKLRTLFVEIRRAKPDSVETFREPVVTVLHEMEEAIGPSNAALISEMADKLKKSSQAS
jgi:TIR domain